MKAWLKALLSEDDRQACVGAVSVLLIVLAWTFCLIWAQVKNVPLAVAPTALAALAVALYGLRKVPDIVSAIRGVRNAPANGS